MRECQVVEGIVWVWMGDEASTIDPPTQGDGLETMDPVTGKHDDYIINDFQIDLPYDHSYLVEVSFISFVIILIMMHICYCQC